MQVKNDSALRLIKWAAVSGFLVVSLGAFGAHGLKSLLSDKAMDTYQTAVLYHMFHTVVIFALSAASAAMGDGRETQKWITISGNFFLIGLALFCGSLYLLAISGLSWLGFITPIGGLSFLIAWLCVLFAFKARPLN